MGLQPRRQKTFLSRKQGEIDECAVMLTILGSVVVAGWADNLLFMPRTIESAQHALNIFTQGLHKMGMRWKASSVQYLREGFRCGPCTGDKRKATGNDDDEEDTANRPLDNDQALDDTTAQGELYWSEPDGTRHTMERIDHLELFGCMIMTDHRAAMQNTHTKASSAFRANRAFFLSSVIPWRHKILEFVKKLRPVALYGSAAWTWSADTSAALRSWEGAMLRRMCRVGWRKADGESFGDRRRRHTDTASSQLDESGAEDVTTAMFRRQFRWVLGNLRRFAAAGTDDADDLTTTRLVAPHHGQHPGCNHFARLFCPLGHCWRCYDVLDDRRGRLEAPTRDYATAGSEERERMEAWQTRQGQQMGVMLRALGPRWNERLLAGDTTATIEDEYVGAGMTMVGRTPVPPNGAVGATTTRHDQQIATKSSEATTTGSRSRSRHGHRQVCTSCGRRRQGEAHGGYRLREPGQMGYW